MIFAMHQYESATGIHMSFPPGPPSHLPLHPVPPDCHRAPCIIHQTPVGYLLHTIMYMFQCSFLKSPTLSFSHWVQVCSLSLCLLCCPAHRTIGSIFLESIYMASCKLKCLPDWPPWETACNNEVIMVLCIVLLWRFLTIYIFKSAIPPNLGNMDKDYFHFLLKEI